MKLFKTTIIPKSNFITPLKGDTLFGQICWAIKYSFGEDKLNELLSTYEEKPFLIVSDGFAKGYLPKPTLPTVFLNEDIEDKKKNRNKIWLTLEQLQNGKYDKALPNDKVLNIDKSNSIVRNSINYKTFTTQKGFDPYGEIEYSLSSKDIYFLINENFSLEELNEVFTLVSQMGYGKDSSIGKGRFIFDKIDPIRIDNSSKTYMALSPFVAQGIVCKDIYYEPFTRFGKSGGNRANINPFKKPILFANTGAVVHFENTQNLYYLGKSIENISTYKDIVHQGYSIVIPIKDLS